MTTPTDSLVRERAANTAALVIVLTGVEPIQLAEYAVVASILVLPLTYLPLLLLAGDRRG